MRSIPDLTAGAGGSISSVGADRCVAEDNVCGVVRTPSARLDAKATGYIFGVQSGSVFFSQGDAQPGSWTGNHFSLQD